MQDRFPKMLTASEVAEILQVCRHTVYKYARQGHLKSFKVGKAVRFSESELRKFFG